MKRTEIEFINKQGEQDYLSFYESQHYAITDDYTIEYTLETIEEMLKRGWELVGKYGYSKLIFKKVIKRDDEE
jgi:hypothetical protein